MSKCSAAVTRTHEKKLVAELTETYVKVCGGDPNGVHIILQDVDKGNWARGGKLFSEILPD